MKISPLPENEKERLEAIRSLHILDTEAELDFDGIVELATQLCDSPISIITLIDERRQWFKAKTGWDIKETHRDLSFCAHTIHKNDVMVVCDTLQDERFFDNPLVTGDPYIRFYAGMPLITSEGYKLGTLAVLDRKPNDLNEQQLKDLRILGKQVVNLLERRMTILRLHEMNKEIACLVEKKTAEIRNVFERVSDAFVALDKNWCYTYVNTKAEKIFNKPHGYLIGKHIWTEFPEGMGQPFHKMYEEAMATQEYKYLEEYYPPYNQWFENHIYPSPTGLSIHFHDITEVKKAELAIRISEEQKKLIINSALDAIICIDESGVITVWNPQAEKTFGWQEKEMIGKHLVDTIIPTQHRMQHEKGLKRYRATGEGPILNRFIEITALNREGKEFPIEMTIAPIKQDGTRFFCAFVRDISKRKKMEGGLRESEIYLQGILDSTNDGILAIDNNGKIINSNNRFAELWHIPQELIRQKDDNALLSYVLNQLVDPEGFISKVQELYKSDMTDFDVIHFKDGRIFERYSTPLILIKNIVGRVWSFRDITERKKAEESLRQAEERYRSIFENAQEGIYQSTPEGRFITANPALAKMFGYGSPEEFIGSVSNIGAQLYVDPEERLLVINSLEKEGRTFGFEFKAWNKNGEIFWIRDNIRVVYDTGGKIKYFEGTLEDITGRKQAEEKLLLQRNLDQVITRAQSLFIGAEDSRHAFDILLRDLLAITNSEYGFIGAVLYDQVGKPFLKTHTITNIAWNEEMNKFYNDNINEGLVFDNLKTLFGEVMVTGNPVISNQPSIDPRRGGLPKGHPPLNAFLGIPFGPEGKIEGMLGISNRPGGYDESLIEFLQPLVSTITHLLHVVQSEKLRRQSEKRYSQVVASLAEGMILFNGEGVITDCNDSAEKILGVTASQMQGRTIDPRWRATNEDGIPITLNDYPALVALRTGGEQRDKIMKLDRMDGSFLWLSINALPLFDGKDPKPSGVFVTFIDITERKIVEIELRNSENKLRAFFRSTPDASVLLGKDFEILAFNSSANELNNSTYGIDLQEGGSFLDLIFPNVRPVVREFLQKALKGETTNGEFPIPNNKTGKNVLWLTTFMPAYDKEGNIFGVVANATNIHEIKRTERKLTKQFEELQKTNSELDRFVYSVSHDLRAPLASILGLINVAEMENPSQSFKNYLTLIRSSINRLDGFIKDILDYSRNSRMDIKSGKINFHELITETQANLKSISGAERLRIAAEIDDAVAFYSDRTRIGILLSNLFSNSIKYQDFRKDSSFVQVTIVTSSEKAVITVRDNGIGISEKHVSKIFDMFYRASENSKGSGLGLYIAKETVAKLGGSIKVQSEFGVSTIFEITIPNAIPNY